MPRKKRLLWQLYPSYLLITLISVVVVTWYASRALKHFFLEQTARDLTARAHLLEKQVSDYLDPLDQDGLDLLCKRIGKTSSTRITIILPKGEVVGDSHEYPARMDNHVDRPEIVGALTGLFGRSTRYSRTLDMHMMYVAIPLRKNGQTSAVIRTSIPVDAIDVALRDVQIKIAVGGLIIAVVAAMVSLLVSRRITRPIEEMKNWAGAIARGELRVRPPVTRSDEIGALSEAMGQMSIQLHERIDTTMRQRNEIEAMLASMVEGVIAMDMEQQVISMNDAAAEMFGCNPSAAQGKSIQEVVRNADLHQLVTESLSSEQPIEKDILLYTENERFLNGHGTALRDAEGKQIGALIVLNDVTRIQKLENVRRQFVANVSHEIKTPITAIKGFVETLRDGAVRDVDDAERFLGIIGKHVDRLEALIEDLLRLSRIEREADRGEIPLERGAVKDVLETAIQVCEVNAAAKKIRIELACPEGVEAKVNPPLLEQASVNLLSNAIKYSNEGAVVLVEAFAEDSGVVISVKDEGCGIEKDHLPRLFERFYRVDKARSRQLGGTGLGLAIVKHIAQAHGGGVSVQSTPGKGSTFSIHLPKA